MLAPHELECQQCGSRYWVTSDHVPMRDDDTIDCDVCGVELLSWDEAKMYRVELTHRAPWPQSNLVSEDRPKFQPGQRVRVREEGGDIDTQPNKSLLGKEGTIWHGTGSEDSGLAIQYFVEINGEQVEVISPDWLEPR